MFQKKQIFKLNVLKKLLTDDNSCVSLVPTTRLLALPPFFLNDMKSGILYILNAMLKKYDRSLGGIVMGYQNIKLLMDENTGIIPIGTSETEVNISVEFYIFQPKIGSYLEGVINKKSNNHIGCLVHLYFNATILKPEDVDYDDWYCKDLSVEDRITFRVKDLDFTTLLPYIEGVVDDKTSVKKAKKTVNCKVENFTTNYVNKSSENEFLFSNSLLEGESSKGQNCESGFTNNEKVKVKEEVNEPESNLNSNSEEFMSFSSPKKKKKKKEKEKEKNALNFNEQNIGEEGISSDVKMTSGSFSSESEVSLFSKKKKKKKRNSDDNINNQESLAVFENPAEEENPIFHFLDLRLVVDDEDDFVCDNKIKKLKKKKKKESETFLDSNKTSVWPPQEEVEDSVLYSTQLEPISKPQKMKLPFFSPITNDTDSKKKLNKITTQDPNFSEQLDETSEAHKKEEKKKSKKRKREKEELDYCLTPKKKKTSITSEEEAAKIKINGVDGVKSETQITVEEMYKKLLNDAKEQLNWSDKDKSKSKKKKKESKKREKKVAQSESSKVSKNSEAQVNGSEEESDVQSVVDSLLEKEIKRVKQDLSNKVLERSKSSKKSKEDKKEKKVVKEKTKDSSSKLKKKTKTCDVNGG